MGYGISIPIEAPFAEGTARVRDALKAQGFGVLTEIDMDPADVLGSRREHGFGVICPELSGQLIYG